MIKKHAKIPDMKILLTGGAGFIGSNIIDGYINEGYQVIVMDNLSSGKKEFINKNAKFYHADIRDKDTISRIFKKEKPQILNHHAAQKSVRESVIDPVNDAEINLIGILNLLEIGRRNGLDKVIFASSGGVVYGDSEIIPTPENYDPKLPLSPYGVTKLASEYYLNFYYKTYNIPYIALRYSNVYGPRQNPYGEAGVVAIFCQNLLSNIQPVINGNGKQTRDYVFVEDVVRANIKSVATDFIGGINIGTGIETDVNQIYSGIEKIINTKKKPKFGPKKTGEQIRSCLNNKLAKEVLSWRPEFSLSQGLTKTVAYFHNH